MKRITLLLLVLASVFSCEKKEKSTISAFEYTITGHTTNNEGIELALIVPNDTTHKKVNAKIENGKFTFSGISNSLQYAEIRFEQDLKNENEHGYSFLPIFLEAGAIDFSFTLNDADYVFKEFSDVKIKKGKTNITYYKEAYTPSLVNHFTFINNYASKRDSMHTYVYPSQKKKFFTKFDSIYGIEKSPAYLKVLSSYLGGRFPPFDPDYITKEERLKLNGLLDSISSNLVSSNIYKELKFNINALTVNKDEVKFSDFMLKDKHGKSISLKKIVAQNKYTVIDFWWSGCAPCRDFNREGAKVYDKLRAKGIEIIGINVDIATEVWEKSSQKDHIKWIDLYAGSNSQVQLDYQVKSFPTKIVINNNFQIIDFTFKKAEDLLKLTTTKE